MATNLYPPILASSMAAFAGDTCSIYFTLPSATNISSIGHAQVKIVYQSNNTSALSYNANNAEYIQSDSIYYTKITNLKADGDGYWINNVPFQRFENTYYKVQVRLGSDSEMWVNSGDADENLSNFVSWKSEQAALSGFSDWSTVMVFKSIVTPSVTIINDEATNFDNVLIESSEDTEGSLTPIFYGQYTSTSSEPVDKYQFRLLKDGKEIESSGYLQHNAAVDEASGSVNTSTNSHRFSTVLENDTIYSVVYDVITVNLYEKSSNTYTFRALEVYMNTLDGFTLTVEDQTNSEDGGARDQGRIRVRLDTESNTSGNYIITRASEKTNYTVWEDLRYIQFLDEDPENTVVHDDYTVESGVRYKYAVQQENASGIRTSPLYERETSDMAPARSINLESAFLYRDGRQLKLEYDSQLSSFKRTVLSAKQDSLGGKYPYIFRNGDTNYAEFPLTGLISLNMDDGNTFFTEGPDGLYSNGELVVASDKIDTEGLNVQLTDNNIYVERKFREEVEKFLNDGTCKLFKSATEGNIIVSLINITLAPKTELGRMIYSFSATAYEVYDCTLENMQKYGIDDMGYFQEDLGMGDIKLFGQISGLFEAGENLLPHIAEENNYSIGGGYAYELQSLDSVWFEAYPERDTGFLEGDIIYYEAMLTMEEDPVLLSDYAEKLAKANALKEALAITPNNPVLKVCINGTDILVARNKVYSLKDLEIDASGVVYMKSSTPILLNYTCTVNTVENPSETVTAIVSGSVWDQIEGFFVEDEKVLDKFDYWRDDTLLLEQHTENGLIQTLNVFDAIKESARNSVEVSYGTTFEEYLEDTDEWTDGTWYYSFEYLKSFSIETDSGISIYITNDDGEEQEIRVGPSQLYAISDARFVRNIRFQKACHAIVNYRAYTTQVKKGVVE